MNKKGQVYIIAAILLSFIIYELTTVTNVVVQQPFKGDFEKLFTNYEIESSKLVNSLLISGADVSDSFSNFTTLYMSYSKSQNLNFGLITSLSYKNVVRIGNYLKKPIVIDDGGKLYYISGCFEEIPASMVFKGLLIDLPASRIEDLQECLIEIPNMKKVWIGFLDQTEPTEIVWYPFEIQAGKPQLLVVTMQEEGKQRQVQVTGEGYLLTEEHEVEDVKMNRVLGLETEKETLSQ